MERALRGIAGFFILVSLALAEIHSPWWLLFTAFVGANLLQSAFTNWCPMMVILAHGFKLRSCHDPRARST